MVEGSEDGWLAINCNLFAGTAYLRSGDVERSLRHLRKTEALCSEKGFVDDQLLSRLSRLALTARESDPDEELKGYTAEASSPRIYTRTGASP